MATAQDIFEALPGRFNGQAAGGWETTIQFNLAGDGGGTWYMDVKGGTCTVSAGSATAPKATLNTDAATWVGINTGTVNPMTAFMTGKIKVQGDMGQLMKLNNPAIFKKV